MLFLERPIFKYAHWAVVAAVAVWLVHHDIVAYDKLPPVPVTMVFAFETPEFVQHMKEVRAAAIIALVKDNVMVLSALFLMGCFGVWRTFLVVTCTMGSAILISLGLSALRGTAVPEGLSGANIFVTLLFCSTLAMMFVTKRWFPAGRQYRRAQSGRRDPGRGQ